MRQRTVFGKLVPKPESHSTQNTQPTGHPFILLFFLGKQRKQDILHELQQFGAVLYNFQRVETV